MNFILLLVVMLSPVLEKAAFADWEYREGFNKSADTPSEVYRVLRAHREKFSWIYNRNQMLTAAGLSTSALESVQLTGISYVWSGDSTCAQADPRLIQSYVVDSGCLEGDQNSVCWSAEMPGPPINIDPCSVASLNQLQ